MNTNTSLQSERDKTDGALHETRATTDNDANSVLLLARTRADRVLAAARRDADTLMADSATLTDDQFQDVMTLRALSDASLREERGTEDRRVAVEREQRERLIREALGRERQATDSRLHVERDRADSLVDSHSEFLAMASHDLSNLHQTVAVTSALIVKRAPDEVGGHDVVHYADRIQSVVGRMTRLVRHLVDVACIDAGKLGIDPKAGDVRLCLRDVIETFGVIAAEKGVSLRVDGWTESLPAFFDYDRIFQVLGNLLSNAIKFTPAGGSVSVSAQHEEAGVHLRVSDTGQGIPAEKLATIFGRFRQADHVDRRGHGLGLYISKNVIEAHQGRMWRRVRGRGQGFTSSCPISLDGRPRGACCPYRSDALRLR